MSPRRLNWGVPDAPRTTHPYRDTLVVYALLAGLVVVFAWVTGGDIGRAVIVAAAVFVVASAWSLVRWRRILRQRAAEDGAERP